MQNCYNEYLVKKKSGCLPNWETITEKQLLCLYSSPVVSDSMIADLFGVTKAQVRYKRYKYNITQRRISIYNFFNDNENPELIKQNIASKKRLFASENMDSLAIALTHYFFRIGPVEDMHANNQLSESDMKTLNKYMVDRIANVLYLIKEERWLELELLLSFYKLYGKEWDKPNIDLSEIDFIKDYIVSQNDPF